MTENKKKINEGLVTTYISLADIATLDVCKKNEYGETCENLPESELMDILYQHGLDVHQYKPNLVTDTHRAFCTNKPMTCGRWICNERTDKEWLNSGAASIEVILQEADPETRKQMMFSLNRDAKSKAMLEVSRGGKPKHKERPKNIGKVGCGG